MENHDVFKFYKKLLASFAETDGIAYRYFEERHSYPELYESILRFASLLKQYRQVRVALYGEKVFQTYAAIFSIVLSNNIWVPISPSNPTERNRQIIESVKPDLLIHDGSFPENLEHYFKSNRIPIHDYVEIMARPPTSGFDLSSFRKNDLAYIMFTSGSTGKPKGVPMTHENYINFVENIIEILPFEDDEVFSDFHDFAFDISVFYLFAFPLCGGSICPIRQEQDRILPVSHLQKNRITVWSSVPSVIQRVRTFRPDAQIPNYINIMFLCGEPFKLDVLRYCYNNLGLKSVYNFYGLTETGVENFYHTCAPDDLERFKDFGVLPIGKPLPGNEVDILDSTELVIGGCQVTPGYLNGIETTKFFEKNGSRWCKTGDIAEQFEGLYFCKGRLDSQIKISGHRIELMDIEAHLAQYPGVEQVICFCANQDSSPLLGCAIKTSNSDLKINDLTSFLKLRLPVYMIPKDLILFDEMPINANGKLDRKKILQLYEMGKK